MLDVSNDFGPSRGLAAGPRSASAMRKISYDGRVRDSFETQQTDLEFESRATSFDTRGRPSDVSAPAGMSSLNKAQSMSELRRRFEMGSGGAGFGSLRGKGRQEPSSSTLTLPASSKKEIRASASSRSLRASANTNGRSDGATTPTQSVFRNNVVARSNGASAAALAAVPTGLGIAAAGDDSADAAVGTSTGDKTMVEDVTSSKGPVAPTGMAALSAPGSFLMDLDVYDSISRQPSQKFYNKSSSAARTNGANGANGKLVVNSIDSGFSPSAFSDGGFGQEAADEDSDIEPSMSATQSPARSQRATTTTNSNTSPGSLGPSNSSSFYSFNTFRGKTELGNLPEEADEEDSEHYADSSAERREEEEEESEEEENDEPIEFEGGRNGLF